MPTPTATTEYMKLSVSERIQLVEDIWDSIAAEAPNSVELSQTQKAELHRRVAAHRADPSTAVPWGQVRTKLFSTKPCCWSCSVQRQNKSFWKRKPGTSQVRSSLI